MIKKFLRIIFWLSLLTMLGSLYVEHYGDPVANMLTRNFWDSSLGIIACNLCWYIRIFSYPTVFISAVGLYTEDKNVAKSNSILAFIAILFCVYKYGLEMGMRTGGNNSFICVTGATDCSEAKPLYWGFLSLSAMWAIVNGSIIYCSSRILKSTS